MPIAFTRAVSPDIARCELTHLQREAIDPGIAIAQHAEYERVLVSLGCDVRRVAAPEGCPDAVFIEDTAVVFDELAVITRPGALSRRKEPEAVAEALSDLRPLRRIEGPGTLDGGDILRIGRRVFAGRTERTNAQGIEQLRAILEPFGYFVHAIAVHGCLHLKSAVTAIDETTVLLNASWISRAEFAGFQAIEVDPSEPAAANVLRIRDVVLFPAAFPKTAARLRDHGVNVQLVDASELAKAEGALTCCSLIV